jgi:hypothetical protein
MNGYTGIAVTADAKEAFDRIQMHLTTKYQKKFTASATMLQIEKELAFAEQDTPEGRSPRISAWSHETTD